MTEKLILIVYAFMALWAIFSIIYIVRLWKIKDTSRYNSYLYNSIPSIFTTLGILGTFVGIFIGLQKFDVNNINDSIPTLLEGMKTAFSTSIIGIISSIIFRTAGQLVLRSVELQEPPKQTDELSALSEIISVLKENKNETNSNLKLLNTALIGDADTSISTLIVKLKNQVTENQKEQEKQSGILDKIQLSLTGNEESSLLTQLEKLRNSLHDNIAEQKNILSQIDSSINQTNENISTQLSTINDNSIKRHDILINKFDEFGDILKENNTKALVEVMQQATEIFNAQMSELIERLVKENFEELNNSIQTLNIWQQENKEMIRSLTEQFIRVSGQFEISSNSIKEIIENTKKLTNENSHLSNLIQQLQKVMVEDNKYQEIVNNLSYTIEKLKENTDKFDETTNKLNEWILKEHDFKQSVDILITRLEEIEKIKDINGEFWSQTKEQLNEGVSIIAIASRELRNNLDNISEEFTEQLNQTLTSLDLLIQRFANAYYKNKPNQNIGKNIKANVENKKSNDYDDDLPF